jgi:hypothetical protein
MDGKLLDLPYLVVAANHDQFKFYAREKGWTKDIKNYIYLSSKDTIRGRIFRDILFVGEFWENKVLKEVGVAELSRRIYVKVG